MPSPGNESIIPPSFKPICPFREAEILTAKLLLSLLMIAVIWLPSAFVMGSMLSRLYSPRPADYQPFFEVLANIAVTGLTFFCVAWLFSSLFSSPVIAVCAGMITPFVVFTMPIFYCAYFGHIPTNEVQSLLELWHRLVCLTLAPICFVLGTWLYLRRGELSS